jgi:DnaJ-class molecular chaperone
MSTCGECHGTGQVLLPNGGLGDDCPVCEGQGSQLVHRAKVAAGGCAIEGCPLRATHAAPSWRGRADGKAVVCGEHREPGDWQVLFPDE